MCLSLGGASNPFKTCLVGVLVWEPGSFRSLVQNDSVMSFTEVNQSIVIPGLTSRQRDGGWQCHIVLTLNSSLASPPEELELFGSVNATNMTAGGGWFSMEPIDSRNLNHHQDTWATLASSLKSDQVSSDLYTQCNGSSIVAPKRLPKGVFLICGDCAWNGILAKPQSGPCYLGKLMLFHPNMTTLMSWGQQRRERRSVHDLDCAQVGLPKFWSELRGVINSAPRCLSKQGSEFNQTTCMLGERRTE